jgi:hypothetical protein
MGLWLKNQEFEDKLSNEMKNRDEVVLRTIKGSMRRMIRIERVIAKDDKDRELRCKGSRGVQEITNDTRIETTHRLEG